MKVEVFLNALRQMPLTSFEALIDKKPFVILSPHADDETLGAGGLIAAACAAGQYPDVVILTDGSASHPRSKLFPPARLTALRRQESETAVAALGLPLKNLRHFGLPDAQAPKEGSLFDDTVEQVVALLRRTSAASLFVTWGHDPHCDHQTAHALAIAVRQKVSGLTLWSYPIWGWHLDPDREIDAPAPKGCRIDISPWREAKHVALAAYRSQMTDLIADDPDGFRFDAGSIAPFLGHHEYFFEVPA